VRVTIRVPASTANLGPGFDALAMALDLAGEVVLANDGSSVDGDVGTGERMVLEAARRVFAALEGGPPEGLSAEIRRNIPAGRGLGASAMARAAGLIGANALAGEPLSRERLLELGAALEGHPDNIAAALFGGLQVVAQSEHGLVHASVPVAAGLHAVVMVPDFDMPTDESRHALPESLSRLDAVFNIGRAALVVAALATGRFELLRTATEDRLHQPPRSRIFPALQPAIAAALDAGAHGACLSGGGSSVIAFVAQDERGVGEAMVAAAKAAGFEAEYLVTRPSERGAEVTGRVS
jgi:homoserine kinase